jgi:acyl carrier protein
VEIILRTEEVFAVELPDEDCSQVVTVGDFYKLVLKKLDLPYVPVSDIEQSAESYSKGADRSTFQLPGIRPWTTPDVWLTLRELIQDQLQVGVVKIREEARFVQDLGCD